MALPLIEDTLFIIIVLTKFVQTVTLTVFVPIPWPPRSLDITPCDLFAWNFVKSPL